MNAVHAYNYTVGARLRVSDEDAADFLQSQFSQELRPFEAGQCTYGLWLDVKGKVIADSWILCEGPEAFWVLSEHAIASELQAKLERHIIADDVCIEASPARSACALIGTDAATLLEACPEPGRFVRTQDGVIFAGRRARQPSYEVIFGTAAAAAAFAARLHAAGVAATDLVWLQQQRIAAGIPLVPQEIGPTELPGEGGFEADALSFTKGCFLGQEVVARMHNLGQARRALYRVQGEGEVPDCPVLLRTAGGKSAGELRTAVALDSGWLGVALLKLHHVQAASPIAAECGDVTVLNPLRVV